LALRSLRLCLSSKWVRKARGLLVASSFRPSAAANALALCQHALRPGSLPLQVTEEAPLDGGSSSQGRRDLRFGRQTAAAATLADGSVEVTLTWGPPIAGVC
jgi:hypothetical protein